MIDAAPRTVYAIIADYHVGHPDILPKQYFPMLEVERGGVGAGTIIRYQVRLMGRTQTTRAEVAEPHPGRVLTETDLGNGAVTTFTVDPVDGGRRSRVTFATEWTTPGLRGWVERLLAPPMLRRIYAAEMANLARLAESREAK